MDINILQLFSEYIFDRGKKLILGLYTFNVDLPIIRTTDDSK